jgi:hypothetical protein
VKSTIIKRPISIDVGLTTFWTKARETVGGVGELLVERLCFGNPQYCHCALCGGGSGVGVLLVE